MKSIAVIGAGAMGRQIALQCALKGYDVHLNDSNAQALAAASNFAKEYLEGRVAKGKLTPEQKDEALERFHPTADIDIAAAQAFLVIEAIIEQFEPKAKLFAYLDKICPLKTILATNSSNIRGSRLAEVTSRPERVLNLHFFNPALVMELVEVVAHEKVPESVIENCVDFCKSIGKAPVVMRREIPGFIVNRIFRALTREAVSLFEEGYASAEDIDLAVTKGLGHPIGPLKLLDMTGIDVSYLARMDEYNETGLESAKPNRALEEMYKRGDWGRKSGKGFYDYPETAKK